MPDGGAHRGRRRGTSVDTGAVVVEIVGPGDETTAGFDVHARHGADEVLVADPATRTIRLWELRHLDAGGSTGHEETGRSDPLDGTAAAPTAEVDRP